MGAERHAGSESARGNAFIVGMSRAATTWMCKSLNAHPEVAAFGESLFWGRRYLPPEKDGRYSRAHLDKLYEFHKGGVMIHSVDGEGPGRLRRLNRANMPELLREAFEKAGDRPTPAELFQEIAAMVGRTEGKPVVVEKTPHHLRWIDRIEAALPGSRYIIMIRDPYGFMLSYKHQGDRKSDEIRKSFELRWHPIACALVWRSYMRATRAAQRRCGDRALVVRFADVKSDPGRVLDKAQQLLGVQRVDLSNVVPRDNSSFPSERPALAPEDAFWMNVLAGGYIRRYGFARQPARFAPFRIGASFFRFPVWTVLNFIDMKRKVSGSVVRYLWRAFVGA